MKIYANGKNINTMPIRNLLTQGEKFSEKITFAVDKIYNSIDLSDCIFVIKGINRYGEAAVEVLSTVESDGKINIIWGISEYFTAVSGELNLELSAVRYTSENETELVLKYIMAPINIRQSQSGGNVPVPDVTQQMLAAISQAVYNGIMQIRNEAQQHKCDCGYAITEIIERIDILESCPSIAALTMDEYNSIAEPLPNVLYVIIHSAH